MTKNIQGVPEGHVVVTWDQDRTRILAVTRQDDDGRILSVIAEIQAPAEGDAAMPPLEEALKRAYYYDERGAWRGPGVDEWDRWHAVAKVAAQPQPKGTAESWPCPKCGVERGIFPACAQDGCPLMVNGLTEAETAQTASVMGLTQSPAPGAVDPDGERFRWLIDDKQDAEFGFHAGVAYCAMRRAHAPAPGVTPLSDQLEATRRELGQERTPAYGDALALCRRLEAAQAPASRFECAGTAPKGT